MLVYEGIKSTFIEDVNLNLIVNKIYEKYQRYFGRTTKSQLNSWQNSMQYMRSILDDDEIPDNAGVAIEFNIPTTSKRIDFILSGRDHDMKDSAVIVELKQWETCAAVEKSIPCFIRFFCSFSSSHSNSILSILFYTLYYNFAMQLRIVKLLFQQ